MKSNSNSIRSAAENAANLAAIKKLRAALARDEASVLKTGRDWLRLCGRLQAQRRELLIRETVARMEN